VTWLISDPVDLSVDPDAVDGDESDEPDTAPESAGSANATAGVLATATPIPSATANAPTRPMYFALPIAVPSSRSRRNDGHLRRVPSSAMQIVTRVRRKDISSAPLQSRPFSEQYYLVVV